MRWMLLAACATAALPARAQEVLFADGIEDCSAMDRGDEDRLSECMELAVGSDPLVDDTDGDGLSDGDEVLGTLAGLNLPAFGVKPTRQDLLLEIDWVDDAWQCAEGQHSHRPEPSSIEGAKAMFAAAPVANVDGSSGINLIVDSGQGGVFAGGTAVTTIDNGFLLGLATAKQARVTNSAWQRMGFFRYQLHAHRYGQVDNDSSGLAEMVGDDSAVTLHCARSAANVRNTIVHELGHNLGLHHGGDNGCNFKRNYNSVMNYLYQFDGLDTDCDGRGDGIDHLGFSSGSRPALDEMHLDEFVGVCGLASSRPVDFNGGGLHADVQMNLNGYEYEQSQCGGLLTTLTDFDDWSHLVHKAGLILAGGANPPDEATCASPP